MQSSFKSIVHCDTVGTCDETVCSCCATPLTPTEMEIRLPHSDGERMRSPVRTLVALIVRDTLVSHL